MRLVKFILYIFCLILLSSCFFIPKPEIEISLPSVPFSGSCSLVSWIIEYPDSTKDGRLSFTNKEVTGNPCKINIMRGVNLPIFAYPVFEVKTDNEITRFTGNFPAAAVYPADVRTNSLVLQWSDGFACNLLKRSLCNTEILQGFDTIVFREKIKEKAAELPCACWNLDDRSILSRLAYGVFRESSIQTREVMDFSIVVSGGVYYSDNFLYPAIKSNNESGQVMLDVVIPKSIKTTFINAQNGEIIECYFDDNYWCYLNKFTGYSLSGR